MHILFLTPYVPTPIRTRPYNLLKALAGRGHRLSLFCIAQGEGLGATRPSPLEEQALAELRALGIEVRAVFLPRLRSLYNCLRALPTPLPLQAVYCWSPALAHLLRDRVQALCLPPSLSPALIHIEHLRAARYGLWLRDSFPQPLPFPVVWDSVDCISHLFEQSARVSRSAFGRLITRLELGRTRRYERLLSHAFDRTLVTSPVDAAALMSLSSVPLVSSPFVLPNGVDLAYFCPSDGLPHRPEVVFIGKMSYHANVTAALYLAREIMPLVWRHRPDVHLTLVGSRPPSSVRALAGKSVTVTGYVRDVRPFLYSAAVAVAPMPYGAGIQNKVLEAMACACPVVATPQAVSALAAQPGRHLLVGQGPEQLAAHILYLLEHPGETEAIGRAGRAYVEQHHDWQVVVRRLENLYREEFARRIEREEARWP